MLIYVASNSAIPVLVCSQETMYIFYLINKDMVRNKRHECMHFQIPVTYLVWKHPYNCTSLFEIKHSMNLGEHRTHLPVKKAMWAIPLAWEVATKGLTLRPTIRYCGENIWTCRVGGHAQGIYLRVGMDQEGKEHTITQNTYMKSWAHQLIEKIN